MGEGRGGREGGRELGELHPAMSRCPFGCSLRTLPRSSGFESVILRGNVKRGEGLVIQSLNRERAARRAARDSLDFLDTPGSSDSHPYSCEEMLDMGSG